MQNQHGAGAGGFHCTCTPREDTSAPEEEDRKILKQKWNEAVRRVEQNDVWTIEDTIDFIQSLLRSERTKAYRLGREDQLKECTAHEIETNKRLDEIRSVVKAEAYEQGKAEAEGEIKGERNRLIAMAKEEGRAEERARVISFVERMKEEGRIGEGWCFDGSAMQHRFDLLLSALQGTNK